VGGSSHEKSLFDWSLFFLVTRLSGGWPKDINYLDPEQTLRYRRKLEKDESYITQLPKLGEVSST
jgi:hypothetical protein